jgi:hypothetical protein
LDGMLGRDRASGLAFCLLNVFSPLRLFERTASAGMKK